MGAEGKEKGKEKEEESLDGGSSTQKNKNKKRRGRKRRISSSPSLICSSLPKGCSVKWFFFLLFWPCFSFPAWTSGCWKLVERGEVKQNVAIGRESFFSWKKWAISCSLWRIGLVYGLGVVVPIESLQQLSGEKVGESVSLSFFPSMETSINEQAQERPPPQKKPHFDCSALTNSSSFTKLKLPLRSKLFFGCAQRGIFLCLACLSVMCQVERRALPTISWKLHSLHILQRLCPLSTVRPEA